MRALRLLLPLVGLLLLSACGDASPQTAGANEEAAFALLSSLDAGAVTEAYQRLDGYAYTVEVRLTEEHAGERRQAQRRLTRRPTPDGVATRVVAVEGAWGEEAWGDGAFNPLPPLLPDEPAFLTPQSREQYRYTVRPDTTIRGRRLRVVEARLRPEAGDEQAIRRARFLIDPRSDAVLGVEVDRASASALFDETGHAAVYLRPGPDDAPVPAHAVAETMVDVSGAPPRRLRLEWHFGDVHRAE